MHKFEPNWLSGFGVGLQHAQRNKIIVPKYFFPPKPKTRSGDRSLRVWNINLKYFCKFLSISETKN